MTSSFSRLNALIAMSVIGLGTVAAPLAHADVYTSTYPSGMTTTTNNYQYTSTNPSGYYAQCGDGTDNDRDGKVDYPDDTDCTSVNDTQEGPHYNLGITTTVTDNRTQVAPGRPISYNIVLRPTFTDGYRNVNVDLYLPNGVVFTNASNGGVITTGRVHWDSVAINAREGAKVLTVNASVSEFVKDGQIFTTRAVVEGQETIDTSTVSYLAIDPGAQFRMNLDDGKQYSLPGDENVYTLKVKNISNLTSATDVKVLLPVLSEFLRADGDYKKDDLQTIIWKNTVFQPGEEKIFSFTVKIDRSTLKDYVIRVRATAGSVTTADTTIIRLGAPAKAVTLSITDGTIIAERGQLQTIHITLRNSSSYVATNLAVTGALPLYTDFVSADQGGTWDGTNVRWNGLQVTANATRTLSYTLRIRKDAPLNERLVASAALGGTLSRDASASQNLIVRDSTRVVPNAAIASADSNLYALGDQIDPATGITMPRTGADMADVAGAAFGLAASASAFFTRRKILG